MKAVKVSAPGRIDLVGGPTDWCGMNTLSMAINLRATVTAVRSKDPSAIQISIGDEKVMYTTPEYDGKLDLFKAVIELSGLTGFEIAYETAIPKGSGLGGSAPLTVATVMALKRLFDKSWSPYYMAELAQRAETYKLHTVNGYQDQYTAMFGGLIFMNFDGKSCQRGNYSKTVEEEPYATVEDLTPYIPIFNPIVAVPRIERVSSDQTNGSLSDRYLSGEKLITDLIASSAVNAKQAKKCIVERNISGLYTLINEENKMLRTFGFVSDDDEKILKTAQGNGAVAAKVCGAGRGAVAIFAPDPHTQKNIFDSLQGTVEHLYMPTMDTGARYE